MAGFDRVNFAAAAALAALPAFGMASEATAQGAQGTVGEVRACPAHISQEIFGPMAIQYSWGVVITQNDGSTPQRTYTWTELARLGCYPESREGGLRGRR